MINLKYTMEALYFTPKELPYLISLILHMEDVEELRIKITRTIFTTEGARYLVEVEGEEINNYEILEEVRRRMKLP